MDTPINNYTTNVADCANFESVGIACRSKEEAATKTEQILKQHGFYNAQYICNLDNPVHQILDKSNWMGVSDVVYKFIKPALRLVSLFLTDDRVIDWFIHSMIGIEKWTADGKKYLVRNQIQDDPTERCLLRDQWLAKLKQLQDYTIFRFSTLQGCVGAMETVQIPPSILTDKHSKAKDKTLKSFERRVLGGRVAKRHANQPMKKRKIQLDLLKRRWEHPTFLRRSPHIIPLVRLSDEYMTYITKMSDLNERHKQRSDKEFLEFFNFQLMLAITIAHEIAHVAHKTRLKSKAINGTHSQESFLSLYEASTPCLQDQGRPEAGWSWERSIFGEVPNSVGMRSCHSSSREAFDDGLFGWIQFRRKGHIGILFPADFVVQWFTKEHWAPDRTRGQVLKRLDGKFKYTKKRWYHWDLKSVKLPFVQLEVPVLDEKTKSVRDGGITLVNKTDYDIWYAQSMRMRRKEIGVSYEALPDEGVLDEPEGILGFTKTELREIAGFRYNNGRFRSSP